MRLMGPAPHSRKIDKIKINNFFPFYTSTPHHILPK